VNLRTFLWFLSRPPLHAEMCRRLGWSLTHRRIPRSQRERLKRLSSDWCASRSCRREDFLREIKFKGTLRSVAELYPEIWRRAREAAASCPVSMGGAGEVDLLYSLCLHSRAERVVETGVAYGWSSLAILLALERMQHGCLVSSDMPYAHRSGDRYVGCVVPAEMRGRWKLHQRPDRDVLPRVVQSWPAIDLAHYDSDKSERGRSFGYTLLWEILRPGGLLVSDDIQDNPAFQIFSESTGRKPWVLASREGTYLGILRK
jgi:predicted O-methyltransferase YrrM